MAFLLRRPRESRANSDVAPPCSGERRRLHRPILTSTAAARASSRSFSADLPAAQTADAAFVEAWKKVIPSIGPPKSPSLAHATKASHAVLDPIEAHRQFRPSSGLGVVPQGGQLGVLPGHVATIAELKPGVLSIHEGNDVTKYFVSSGFAFVHANSYADIITVEAIPIDRIDSSLVQKGLAEFTQKLSSSLY